MAWNQNFGEGAKPGSEYSQQSWRDNFNGGAAAGDWTGNVNARLEAERAAFQGATWSGSSSQPSALELAQAMAGPGQQIVSTGVGAAASSGPGVPDVVAGPATGTVGSGPGSRIAVTGTGPLIPKMASQITEFMIGGWTMQPNPFSSNAAEVEDRWGDAEFLSPGWFANWGIAISDMGYNATGGKGGDRKALDEAVSKPGALEPVLDAFGRQGQLWDRQLHEVFGGGTPYVGGSF